LGREILYPFLAWILDLLPPVSMIMQKIIIVPGVHHRFQKHPYNLPVPHAAEAAIGGLNATAYNAKLAIPNFFAEKIIFRVQRLFIESAKLVEGCFIKQHEHAGAERLDQQRSILRNVVQEIKRAVACGSL
jgi:hypothetical protein